ncbi:MAG TPA: phosphoadenylyl-sulfate reductase [Burkholderiaceae bacterium]|nr:phosphoadenylyl-sulfate reductase [Burkholderiaceae bacterium]
MSAIERNARATPGFDARVAHALALLQDAVRAHGPGLVQATSLGAEDMVVTDLIARHQLPIDVATLDTRMLHPETLALIPRIAHRYALQVKVYRPEAAAVAAFTARHGERAMFQSVELRKACCAVRKLEPLARLLEGRSAWVTGLRREQSGQRAEVPFAETEASGRSKFNPLADWSWHDVWHYIATREVPYNELHDRFFPSIGCAPCTRAIALGEDFRAGRWWWEQDGAKECGLHVQPREGATT